MTERLLSGSQARKANKKRQPAWSSPMLAVLTDDHFSDDGWNYERKLDGERCLVFMKRKRAHLYSRNQKSLNATYPEIVEAFEQQERRGFIVDGEIVVFEKNRTSFARLQQRMKIKNAEEARQSAVAVYYYVFDVLYAEGHDLCRLPLSARRQILKRLLEFSDPIRLTPYRRGQGKAYFREACSKGWEGLIAKRRDAPYKHSRSSDWLKFKCVHEQELVIGGFTDPGGSRIGFGALLVGYYDRGNLKYAGKVGTGFDDETLKSLSHKMGRLKCSDSPFDEPVHEKSVHWVEPKLVGQFGFTEWTDKGRLRHPRFLGLRRDKSPREVRRERRD